MSAKKLGLVPRLIIAIIVGILIGQFLPLWIVRIFKTFSTFLVYSYHFSYHLW